MDVQKAFEQSGLTESLALLCQTLPGNEGQKYEELLASLKDTATEDRDQAIRKALNSSALAALEHLHETTQWYSSLLQSGKVPELSLATKLFRLQANMAWKADPRPDEKMGDQIVREFQAQTFQEDDVAEEKMRGGSMMKVPGTHFSMMHEPNATKVALKISAAIADLD